MQIHSFKTEIPNLHKYSDPLLWDVKLSSGASCFHWSSLRCFYNLIGFHLRSFQLIGHDLKKAHTGLYKGPTADSACLSKNQAIRLKELSEELRDQIVPRHRSGEGFPKQLLHHWRSSRTKWPQSFLKMELVWNHQDSSESWPPSQTEQLGEKGLGQGGDQQPDGHSDRATEFLCGDGRTFQKHTHLCSTPPIRPYW